MSWKPDAWLAGTFSFALLATGCSDVSLADLGLDPAAGIDAGMVAMGDDAHPIDRTSMQADGGSGMPTFVGPPVPADERGLGYAIVVSQATLADPAWSRVVEAARQKHEPRRTQVFSFATQPAEVRSALAAFRPRHLAFITQPKETTPPFVRMAHDLASSIDPDVYVDAVWGIITGFTAEDALAQIAPEPIVIGKAVMRTGSSWLKYFQRGLYLTEDARNPGQWGIKQPNTPPTFMSGGPTDDTVRFVDEVNSDSYQLIMGSGHGNHDRWQLMYPTGDRVVVARGQDGTLWANDSMKRWYRITSTNPKVYWAVGNCLTGFIHGRNGAFAADYRNSFALAWMRAGVKNYLGATNDTAYPTFWFHPNYMQAMQDRWTYAESVFLLRQEIHYELTHGLSATGDAYTEQIMVLYGDPALHARLARELPPALDESVRVEPLGGNRVRLRYQVRVVAPPSRLKRGEASWRVHATLLPFLVSNARVESTTFTDVEVTGETLVWNSGTPLGVGETRTVTLTGSR